jgi:hypothetical protein
VALCLVFICHLFSIEENKLPLVDHNNPSVWSASYTGGYIISNTNLVSGIKGESILLRNALGIQPGQRIAMIGGGFGWERDQWIADGFGPVCVVDNSTYIQGNKGSNSNGEILNEDGTTTASRRAIRVALGGTSVTVDWAISMDCFPWFTNAECTDAANAMQSLATNVGHWLTCVDPANASRTAIPTANWKTLQQWKAMFPNHKCVQRGTDTVL